MRGGVVGLRYCGDGCRTFQLPVRSFSSDEPDRLIRALLRMAVVGVVAEEVVTPFGRKYIMDGMLETPNGWVVNIRSVWMVRKSEIVPHFVTAYPR